MKTSILKRIVGLALAASMLISYVPVPVLAAESPCTHEHTPSCYQEVTKCVHTHDDTCGYVAAVEGQSCTCEPDENGVLTHVEGCGYREAVAGVPCGHVCTEESGCVTKVLSCQHVHDETCGYAAAVEEQPCTFECAECAEEEAGESISETTECSHVWDDGEILTPAQDDTPATVRYTCILCGETLDQEAPRPCPQPLAPAVRMLSGRFLVIRCGSTAAAPW